MKAVLGVSGSVAAYRAADLARDLMRAGFEVRVCLTDAAQKFVSAALFEALTSQPCLIDTFEEPVRGRMAHIDWARAADLVVVAPATANTIAKLAGGFGDDMLTTICLATTAPLVVAPAMNPQMYGSETNRENLRKLASRATAIVEPTEGDVACGENGQGKLASNLSIVETCMGVARRSRLLEGQVVIITSGPTREHIDDVRFLTNRSSGKMGAALARAAQLLGAKEVHVISGPVNVAYPLGSNVVWVESAEEMLEEASAFATRADLIIGAAAVADYRPTARASGKLRRGNENIQIDLMPNPDVISQLSKLSSAKIVGFAAEPSADLEEARGKLKRKGLHAIAVNDISRRDAGFDTDQNELTLIAEIAQMKSGHMSKLQCAIWLLENVAKLS